MRSIKFIAYYSDPTEGTNRKGAPASDAKISYLINVLQRLGYSVEIISMCEEDDRSSFFRINKAYEVMNDDIHIHFFDSISSKNPVIRTCGRLISKYRRFLYFKKTIANDDIVIFYHSLALLDYYKFFNNRDIKFVVEAEEIYADVLRNDKTKEKELNALRKASSFIFPTENLNVIINLCRRPYVVVHGVYLPTPKKKSDENIDQYFKDTMNDYIHCVYAGTFDPRKGGAEAAIRAARYLPNNYYMHIIGFGTKEEVDNITSLISETQKFSAARITYDGLFRGDDYCKYIQKCDIGLSTQNPSGAYNESSFPSKILSYLSNGLHVVSICLPVVEDSSVGNLIEYYGEQDPRKIAEAIMSVKIDEEYDSRQIIKALDRTFSREFKNMLEEY